MATLHELKGRVVRTALLAGSLLAGAAIGLPAPPATASPGVPDGVTLLSSGTIKVRKAGTVVEGKDVRGEVYVMADNVTIRNTRVTSTSSYTIRIVDGVRNTAIEDVDIVCAGGKTNGPAWSNYTARRVAVSGPCKNAFIEGSNTMIYDSSWNGNPIGITTSSVTTPTVTTPPTTTPPVTTLPVTEPPETVPTTTTLLTGRTSDRASVIANAGLTNESSLRPSGTVHVNQEGAVVENLDISGSINVNANNVTIRNVRVTGSSSTALIKPQRGITGTIIEHCEIIVTSAGANGGIGYLGNHTTVRFCEISGFADGIKVESSSRYENNYIHMAKPAGSNKHLDGIQGSGDSDYVIQGNVIEVPIQDGGNAAIFVQAWNGAQNSHVRNVVIKNNHLAGGNYTVFLNGGKDADGSDPASWVHDYHLLDNTFDAIGFRYGSLRVVNCSETTVSGNVMVDGTPLLAC